MSRKLPLILLLAIVFLDTLGIGLICPIFASLLFDSSAAPLPIETSGALRGMWMGVLIALASVVQFFCSPLLGSLSDQKGRKPMLLIGLVFGLIGYAAALLGLMWNSLSLLIVYRLFIGVSMGTITVIRATFVDLSKEGEKTKNFSLFNMAWGAGFALGPFLGGVLSDSSQIPWFGYMTPFWVCLVFAGLNLIMTFFFFPETRQGPLVSKVDLLRGIRQMKWAFTHPQLRLVFLSFFFFVFGWSYFIEFISVTLKEVFAFTPSAIGGYLGYLGLTYAFAVVFVTAVLSRYFSLRKLLIFSMLASGTFLLSFLGIHNPKLFWFFIPIFSLLVGLFFPLAATYISNRGSKETQGEILGIYDTVYSASFCISPLISGALISSYPLLPIHLGGWAMICGGIIFLASLLPVRIFWQRKP